MHIDPTSSFAPTSAQFRSNMPQDQAPSCAMLNVTWTSMCIAGFNLFQFGTILLDLGTKSCACHHIGELCLFCSVPEPLLLCKRVGFQTVAYGVKRRQNILSTFSIHACQMPSETTYIQWQCNMSKTIKMPMADAYSGGCNGCFAKKNFEGWSTANLRIRVMACITREG